MDNKYIVKEYLSKVLRKNDFEDDEDIFASGSVNSLFAMQLILFLEKRFGITVGKKDLDRDNFKSLNAITKFLDTKISNCE